MKLTVKDLPVAEGQHYADSNYIWVVAKWHLNNKDYWALVNVTRGNFWSAPQTDPNKIFADMRHQFTRITVTLEQE